MARVITDYDVESKVLGMAIEGGLYNEDGKYPEDFIVEDKFGRSALVANRRWCENEYLTGIVSALKKFVVEKPGRLEDEDWERDWQAEVGEALRVLACRFANPLK